jgi:hypothetical protein
MVLGFAAPDCGRALLQLTGRPRYGRLTHHIRLVGQHVAPGTSVEHFTARRPPKTQVARPASRFERGSEPCFGNDGLPSGAWLGLRPALQPSEAAGRSARNARCGTRLTTAYLPWTPVLCLPRPARATRSRLLAPRPKNASCTANMILMLPMSAPYCGRRVGYCEETSTIVWPTRIALRTQLRTLLKR